MSQVRIPLDYLNHPEGFVVELDDEGKVDLLVDAPNGLDVKVHVPMSAAEARALAAVLTHYATESGR